MDVDVRDGSHVMFAISSLLLLECCIVVEVNFVNVVHFIRVYVCIYAIARYLVLLIAFDYCSGQLRVGSKWRGRYIILRVRILGTLDL